MEEYAFIDVDDIKLRVNCSGRVGVYLFMLGHSVSVVHYGKSRALEQSRSAALSDVIETHYSDLFCLTETSVAAEMPQ